LLEYYNGCYRFYNDAWDYVYTPTTSGEHVQTSLETRRLDVKTESQTMDPKTTGQASDPVIDVVMRS